MFPKTGLTFLMCVAPGPAAFGQTLPPGFTAADLVTAGLANPTCFCLAPDGRVFIAEKTGALRIWKPSAGLLPSPFHQFAVDSTGERGLIGVVLDPAYSVNRYLYAHVSRAGPQPGGSILRVTASAANPDVSESASEAQIFDVGAYSAAIEHKGGGLHFGPDDRLYIGVGDDGVPDNAQSLLNRFGKLLRIGRDGSVPADNPASFPGIAGTTAGPNRAIWAVGLRNPYTFAFQPGSGRLFINDVGNLLWEEINSGAAGANYGWPQTEGDFNSTVFPNFTRPMFAYGHLSGTVTGRAIVGGAFYNPVASPFPPDFYGDYFFADHETQWIKRLDTASLQVSDFADNAGKIVDVRIDAQGRLFYLSYNPPRLVRADYVDPLPPTVLVQPADLELCAGQAARFSVVPAGTFPLAYQWRRNGLDLKDGPNVSGATSANLLVAPAQSADSGAYDCVVANAHGTATSDTAALVVYDELMPNGSHVQPFVDAALGHATSAPEACWFDFDGDGTVGAVDIDGFVTALLSF